MIESQDAAHARRATALGRLRCRWLRWQRLIGRAGARTGRAEMAATRLRREPARRRIVLVGR